MAAPIRHRNGMFTDRAQHGAQTGAWGAGVEKGLRMAGLAMAMFIALFAFGSSYFGWEDPSGRVSLALFASYVFGIICGYRVKS